MRNKTLPDKWFYKFLVCPNCASQFDDSGAFSCTNCEYSRKIEDFDFRPDAPTPVTITHTRRTGFTPNALLSNLDTKVPTICYSGPAADRDSGELLSEIMNHLQTGDTVLDLGCGPRDQAKPIEFLNYHYVGVDYSHPNADMLVDAHAIPFASETFDCVLSYAVLEHLHSPLLALREIERVLKPGGIYVGTVSQGEPFHDSYFHHTSWGIVSLMENSSNLQLLRIWPSYDTLSALSTMAKYPKVIRSLIAIADKLHRHLPFLAPRKMQWTKAEKQLDRIHRAGSLCFVVKKAA